MTPQPPQTKIQLTNTADYREHYANSVQVRVSLWDFFLLFGTMNQSAPDAVTIHKACFVMWFGVTGIHVLTRFITSLAVIRPLDVGHPRVAGARARLAVVSVVAVTGLGTGFAVLHYAHAWTGHSVGSDDAIPVSLDRS